MAKFMAKFRLEDYGIVWLVRPLTSQAADLLQATAPDDAIFFGGALAVQPRYVGSVVLALGDVDQEEAPG